MSKTKTADAPSLEAALGPRFKVIAAGGPRRRANLQFGPTPVILTIEELGGMEEAEKTIKLLMADPQLSVAPVLDEDESPKGKKAKTAEV